MTSTICALATAPGGAIGIIRLSGPAAFPIVRRLCCRITATTPPRTAILSPIRPPAPLPVPESSPSVPSSPITVPEGSPSVPPAPSLPVSEGSPSVPAPLTVPEGSPSVPPSPLTVPEGSPEGPSPSPSSLPTLDDALVTLFPAPHSYTGEDCVELSCHGSRYILNKVLELLVEQGARLAEPGEFTKRAYLNGKLDLSQAEAVADLIAADSAASHRIALSQLRGHFSSELSQLRDQLLRLTSLLELELDFSDHEELEFADRSELLDLAQTIDRRIQRLAATFHAGNALKQGIPVAIVGAPNVGKSTLLNALLGEERAIVSDIQGTTRDSIEDTIQLDGITFRFIDTAGIRTTDDTIEQLGIQRTYAAIDKATIVLWLIDQEPTAAEITDMQARCEGKTLIIIQNKIDKSPVCCDSVATLPLSAKYGTGLDDLRTRLIAAAPTTSGEDVVVTSARHYEALLRAHDSLTRVIAGLYSNGEKLPPYEQGWGGAPTDLIAEDLRLTLDALADITGGAITPQETLNTIFSHFCIGK